MTRAQVTISREVVQDTHADYSFLEQNEFKDRLKAWQNGEFGFVGVRAVAEIRVPYGHDFIVTELKSPGLWSIESDSDESYFAEVFEEEKKTLLEMLESLHDFELA